MQMMLEKTPGIKQSGETGEQTEVGVTSREEVLPQIQF